LKEVLSAEGFIVGNKIPDEASVVDD